ncbi:hypothetical protein FRB99_007381 [Tulasnella sp. 403]|nr:hypothetical protein FRB99_007381 [Tulasnella sp. 403]
MAMGSIMNVAWVITADTTVPRGAYCTAQGVIKQIGGISTALAILVIAIYTFLLLVMRWHPRGGLRLTFAVIALIWLILLLTSAIPGSVLDHYYGPSLYWCWIEPRWDGERLGLAYALYWLAAVVVICLYLLLFLSLRGNLKVGWDINPENMGKFSVQWQWTTSGNAGQPEPILSLHWWRAREMVVYLIAYLVLITPITVIRWVDFSGKSVPYQARFFADAVFASSGLVNVTLYLVIRGISAGRGPTGGDTQRNPRLGEDGLGTEDRRAEKTRRDQVVNAATLADSFAGPSSSAVPWSRTRRDPSGRSYGLGMVSAGSLSEEPNDANISGRSGSPAFPSSGSTRSHLPSAPPEDRV